jgi:tripartite ATP-independent transporter DctM subunit
MAFGMPIGFAMLMLGIIGFTYLVKFSGTVHILVTVPYSIISNYDYCVLPLFLFMAAICLNAGLGRSLFRLVYTWIGNVSGGLAAATIGSCAFFSAASASSIATAVTMGLVAIPEMRKYNYSEELATGCVAAGGTLGILIPPSGVLILYGIITQESITDLFIAGIIPGISLALLFIICIIIICKINPRYGPAGQRSSMKEKLASLTDSIEMILLLALVIAGLIIGWFTPTEAGAVGAFGALVLSVIRRRLSWKGLKDSLVETIRTTGMIFSIIVGAFVFNSFLAVTTLPTELAAWVTGFGLPPISVIIIIMLVYLVLGCFIDAMSMILLTIPIFYPIITQLGYSPIWFGIIIVLVVEMALITPPVGMNVYIISGIVRDVPMQRIFKGIIPFVVIEAFFIALMVAFPQIALFLPNISG